MLSSISPVGETSRGQRFAVTVTAYVIGSASAAAATGGLLGLVGQPAQLDTTLWPVALAGAVGLVADWRGWVPSLHRQVDREWLSSYRGWVYGLGFGAQLGTGVATVVPASIVWVMWVAAVASGSSAAGALIGVTFGVLRAAPLVWAGRLRTVAALRTALAAMESMRRPAAQVTIAGQAAVTMGAASLAIWGTL